jgi:hypothetical protein
MKLLLLSALALLQGCTAVTVVSSVVSGYCALDEAARKLNREAVALAVAPNRIFIYCAGDADAVSD